MFISCTYRSDINVNESGRKAKQISFWAINMGPQLSLSNQVTNRALTYWFLLFRTAGARGRLVRIASMQNRTDASLEIVRHRSCRFYVSTCPMWPFWTLREQMSCKNRPRRKSPSLRCCRFWFGRFECTYFTVSTVLLLHVAEMTQQFACFFLLFFSPLFFSNKGGWWLL